MPTVDVQSLVNDDRRVIPLFAVHNFRDLGGYPTADGRHTRWRTLFRADGLYRLTPDDARQGRESYALQRAESLDGRH